jgi:hypothetical protein
VIRGKISLPSAHHVGESPLERGLDPRLKLGLMLVITGKCIILTGKIYYCSRKVAQNAGIKSDDQNIRARVFYAPSTANRDNLDTGSVTGCKSRK